MFPTLRRIARLLDRSDWSRLISLMALLLVGVGLETVSIGLLLPFFRLLANPAEIHQIELATQFYRLSGAADERTFLMIITGGLLAVIVLKNAMLAFNVRYQARSIQDLRTRFSSRLFRGYVHEPYVFHLAHDSAELVRNLSQSTAVLFNNVLTSYLQLFTELMVIVGILMVLMIAMPGVAIGVLGGSGALFAAFHLGFKRLSYDYGNRRSDYLHAQLRAMNESFGAIKEIQVLGRQNYFAAQYNEIDRNVGSINAGMQTLNNLPRLVVETLAMATLLVSTIVILHSGQSNSEVFALLGLIGAAAVRLMPSLGRIIQATNNIQTGKRFVDDVGDDFLRIRAGEERTIRVRPYEQRLDLCGVGFAYEKSERPAVSDIHLEIREGESLALVGPSGSGKTTLADIILGLLRPAAGSIHADGSPLGDDEMLGGIGYVPQSIYILSGSLRRNVAFGVDDGAVDEAWLWKCLSMAQLDDLVQSLPQGLDTPLGERGVRLSGGQRQRVGIARALYHRPRLLILDEATAALDVETEKRFTETVHQLAQHKMTLVIIAHRLSTVRECGRIAFLEAGRIQDVAPFNELYQRNTRFRELVELAELRPDHELG